MTAPDSRKDRILTLIIDKVFGEITEADEKELNDLLERSGEERKEWEQLQEQEKLMDFISKHRNEGNVLNLESAKEKFEKLINKNS